MVYSESHQQGVMVAQAAVATAHAQRSEVAAVQYMVYSEIETVGVKCDHGAEAELRIYLAHLEIGKPAQGVASGHIIEVAGHNYIRATEMLYIVAYAFGIEFALHGGMLNFRQQGVAHVLQRVLESAIALIELGDIFIQFLVRRSKAIRLQMYIYKCDGCTLDVQPE